MLMVRELRSGTRISEVSSSAFRVRGRSPPVFSDRNKFHLGRDDALARIPELGDGMAGAGAERSAV